MKLRYMIECELRDCPDSPYFHPVGVWVQGPGPGLDFIIRWLPGYEKKPTAMDSEEEIKRVMKEYGKTDLPKGFLEYWQSTISPYRGDRLQIIRTTRFKSKEECAEAILKDISKCRKDTSKQGQPVAGISLPEETIMREPGIVDDLYYQAGRNAAIEVCLASLIHEEHFPVVWNRHEMLSRLKQKYPEMSNCGGQWSRFENGVKDGLNNMFINYREDQLKVD